MENSGKVCGICLDVIYNQSYINVEDSIRRKLEIVIPERHAQLLDNYILCNGCSQQLNNIYTFKYSCLKVEEIILVKINKIKSDHKLHLTDIMLWTDNTPIPLRNSSENFCRTCLRLYEKQYVTNINVLELLRNHIPEVPIIPMFTENLREAFRTVNLGRRFFLKMYALFKWPLAPIYGGFPVKLTTHLGKPIPYDSNLTPEELQAKVAAAIEDLVNKHQRLPGNILLGLFDRVPYLRLRMK